jgi:hypothetical protein
LLSSDDLLLNAVRHSALALVMSVSQAPELYNHPDERASELVPEQLRGRHQRLTRSWMVPLLWYNVPRASQSVELLHYPWPMRPASF